MHSLLLPILSLYLIPTVVADAYWGYFQQGGTTKLFGSSFGLIGKDATYDYVVVGGGTSGLTVAKRLAEDPGTSVAIIEAGGFYELDNSNVSQIPAFHTFNANSAPDPANIQPLIDWGFITAAQAGLNDRKFHYAQGKTLGGSSARNGGVYHRGTVGTYKQWADIVGDQSFTFDNLLPYFKKSIDFTPPNLAKLGPGVTVPYDPSAFGQGGPVHVSYSNFYLPISPYINKAFEALGLAQILGFNNGKLIGYSHLTDAIDPRAETRSSSETSFLAETVQTTATQIYKQTLAKKILFTGKKATGVQVQTSGVGYTISARKEVILASGVFRTPQLLLVSGIGPSASLSGLGIPVVAELKGVGQSLWDQPNYGLLYPSSVATQSQFANPAFLNQAISDYLTKQEGPLTNPGGDIIGWEKIPNKYRTNLSPTAKADLNKFPTDWPDLELLPSTFGIPDPTGTQNTAVFLVTLLTTTSRGTVTLASTDTANNPIVDPKYLTTKTDQEAAVQSYKRAIELVQAAGYVTGPKPVPLTDDAEILDFLKNNTAPFYHGTGTAKMGKPSDPNAVVDTHGKVLGVTGLRVVDASTFPLTPPGHIMATVYALAEKYADDIRNGR